MTHIGHLFCLHFLPDNLQPTTNPDRGRKRPKQIHQTHPSTAQWPPGGSPRWFQPSVELLVQGSSSSLEMPGHRNNRLLRHVEPPVTCKFGKVSAIFLGEKRSSLPKTPWKKQKNVLQVPRKDMKQALHSLLGVGTSQWLQLPANVTRCHSTQPRPRLLKSSTNAELDGCGYFQMEDSGLKLSLSRILKTANASWSVDPWQLAVLITWQNKHQKGENLQKM